LEQLAKLILYGTLSSSYHSNYTIFLHFASEVKKQIYNFLESSELHAAHEVQFGHPCYMTRTSFTCEA